jgi:hypothetical protein
LATDLLSTFKAVILPNRIGRNALIKVPFSCSENSGLDCVPKTRGRKLRSDVNWQWTLKQKCLKQTGAKQWLAVLVFH